MKTTFWIALVLAGGMLAAGTATMQAAAPTGTRGYSGAQIFSTYGGNKEEGEPNHCGEPGGASSWFCYQAPADGAVYMNTEGSTFDTVLAVYIGPDADYASLESVTCNNDADATNTWSQVVFTATAGTLYFVAVDGVGGASGTVKLNYGYVQPPEIVAGPESQVVAPRATVELTAQVNVNLAPTFQWLFNGTEIPDATNAVLQVKNFQPTAKGKYKVKVKNAAGEALSSEAALYEEGPPRVVEHSKPDKHRFKLRAAGRKNKTYILECSVDLRTWVPLATNTTPTGLVDFEDDTADSTPRRYYRIVELP